MDEKERAPIHEKILLTIDEAAQRFHNVLSGLSDLIDDGMYFNDDGDLTEYGVAQVANFVSEYENARKEVQNYRADIAF